MNNKIEASIILELMGRPAEHLQKAAEELLEALGKEKGIRITSKVLHELKKVENKDDKGKVIEVPADLQLFSTFAELELEANDFLSFSTICFKYMPSHVEIVEPDTFMNSNFELSSMLNELISKLHNYDAIAKSALMQNQMLAQKFKELQNSRNIQPPIIKETSKQEDKMDKSDKKTNKKS